MVIQLQEGEVHGCGYSTIKSEVQGCGDSQRVSFKDIIIQL